MLILILLLLLPVPQQGGKVILSVGIPEAEFYLDANFVSITDKNGTLVMENFPAGSFNFSVSKKGYKQYNGSFTIREGEDKQLSLTLEKTAQTEKPSGQTRENSGAIKSFAEKPRNADNSPPASLLPPPPPKQSAAATAPAARPSPAPHSNDEPDDGSTVLILIILLASGTTALGIWIWKMKHAPAKIPAVVEPPEIENEQSPGDISLRPAPEFIEELKRREELMNAGFVGNKPRGADQEASKEKEIVIVLPKEAFRYEEDK
jgi:hypothetical protein